MMIVSIGFWMLLFVLLCSHFVHSSSENGFSDRMLIADSPLNLDNHHTNQQMFALIDKVNRKCPQITHVYDLSLRTVNEQPLRVIAFSDNPSVHELGEPEFKFVANMHGNEVVGRELLLELIAQLCDAYLDEVRELKRAQYRTEHEMMKRSLIVRLIHSTRIHVLVSMNPDGWQESVQREYKRERALDPTLSLYDMLREQGVKHKLVGRNNQMNIDLNRNFPDLAQFYFKYQDANQTKAQNYLEETKHFLDDVKQDCLGNAVMIFSSSSFFIY